MKILQSLKTIFLKKNKEVSLKAFTLIELLVTIAIVGLLASIVLVSLQGAAASARDGKRDTEAGEPNSVLRKILEVYHNANGNYPWNTETEDEDGCCLEDDNDIKGKLAEYLSTDLKDPRYDPDEADTLDKYCYRYKTIDSGEEYKIRINYEREGYKEVSSWDGEGIAYWGCGDDLTFTYRGSSVTYGTVSHNNECWLDRNLGASRVATAWNDGAANGDLFQWGRLDDGHQDRASDIVSICSPTDVPGHNNFISRDRDPRDWRAPSNDNLWQGISGINNPCPDGWRLPTETEWNTELLSWSSGNYNGAYASPLKLVTAGCRSFTVRGVASNGKYWSSTISATDARFLYFDSTNAINLTDKRWIARSVRCIKD